jgi:hypothetical protein
VEVENVRKTVICRRVIELETRKSKRQIFISILNNTDNITVGFSPFSASDVS